MTICRELGITLEQGLDMPESHFQLWQAYFNLERESIKEQQNKHGQRRNHNNRR